MVDITVYELLRTARTLRFDVGAMCNAAEKDLAKISYTCYAYLRACCSNLDLAIIALTKLQDMAKKE